MNQAGEDAYTYYTATASGRNSPRRSSIYYEPACDCEVSPSTSTIALKKSVKLPRHSIAVMNGPGAGTSAPFCNSILEEEANDKDTLKVPKEAWKRMLNRQHRSALELTDLRNGSIARSTPRRTMSIKRAMAKKVSDSLQSGLRTDGTATGAGFYRNRLTSRKVTKRLVQKDGECNISHINVPKQRSKYMRDIFTTLIDVKWRWSLMIFAFAFLASWTVFAVVYYLIVLSHGDFEHIGDDKWVPCIHNIQPHSFVSTFLFSIESQHTIGYGNRYISEACPEAVFVLCVQSIFGVMIQSFMAGVVFAKLARPKKRAETLIYSKNAVICKRDNRLCFLFRVGDMRRSHIVEAHIRLQMIKKRITKEGELLAFHQFDMDVGFDAVLISSDGSLRVGLDRIFLVWPLTICHVIDEDSPMYEYGRDDLLTARFEIVAILEGIVESTGMTTQARTSYVPSEILWGHRFEKLVTYQRENGEYRIDYARFHNTFPVDTPPFSAKVLDGMSEEKVSEDDNTDFNTLPQLEDSSDDVSKQNFSGKESISVPSGSGAASPIENASPEACETDTLTTAIFTPTPERQRTSPFAAVDSTYPNGSLLDAGANSGALDLFNESCNLENLNELTSKGSLRRASETQQNVQATC